MELIDDKIHVSLIVNDKMSKDNFFAKKFKEAVVKAFIDYDQ